MSHIYIHVPFCLSKCHYCAFYSLPNPDNDIMDRYVAALRQEIGRFATQWPWPETRTVFFGGGTPTLLGPERIGALLQALPGFDSWGPHAEITMEANPGTVEVLHLPLYRQSGINRLSVGVQSLSDSRLRMLGRAHKARQALALIEAAQKAGFETSADLMYGLPGGRFQWFADDARRLMQLGVGHLASYLLSAEPGTPLAAQCSAGSVRLPTEPTQANLLGRVHQFIRELGWDLYEVSNFASTPEHRCQHNMAYWLRKPYLGLGPAAHSFDGQSRWWNPSSLGQWVRAMKSGAAVATSEVLTPFQHLLESLMLGLRISQGVPLRDLARHCTDAEFDSILTSIRQQQQRGMVTLCGESLCPTEDGMLFADRIPVWMTEGLG